MKMVMHFV